MQRRFPRTRNHDAGFVASHDRGVRVRVCANPGRPHHRGFRGTRTDVQGSPNETVRAHGVCVTKRRPVDSQHFNSRAASDVATGNRTRLLDPARGVKSFVEGFVDDEGKPTPWPRVRRNHASRCRKNKERKQPRNKLFRDLLFCVVVFQQNFLLRRVASHDYPSGHINVTQSSLEPVPLLFLAVHR